MAEKATIARPYAKAAFSHARADGQLAQWSGYLSLAATIVSDASFTSLLNHPRIAPTQLVDVIAEGAKLNEGARNFVATLAQNRRLGLLPQIASMYEALRAEVENIADVEVVSALPLDAAQQQRLATALKTRLQREVRLQINVDAALMGGAIVRCGDLVIDGSVRERLARLSASIVH